MNEEDKINEVECPVCGKKLGEGLTVDNNSIGWVCSHEGYDIKIYQEFHK